MLLLKHPDSGLYYTDSHILAYSNLTDPPLTPEEAVDELEREGFERVWPENIESGPAAPVVAIGVTLAMAPCGSGFAHAGFRPGDPSPDLLTESEAIRYLRLDIISIKNPGETLQRYRKEGHLKGTQVSKRVFYRRKNLDEFLDRMTEINPR